MSRSKTYLATTWPSDTSLTQPTLWGPSLQLLRRAVAVYWKRRLSPNLFPQQSCYLNICEGGGILLGCFNPLSYYCRKKETVIIRNHYKFSTIDSLFIFSNIYHTLSLAREVTILNAMAFVFALQGDLKSQANIFTECNLFQ